MRLLYPNNIFFSSFCNFSLRCVIVCVVLCSVLCAVLCCVSRKKEKKNYIYNCPFIIRLFVVLYLNFVSMLDLRNDALCGHIYFKIEPRPKLTEQPPVISLSKSMYITFFTLSHSLTLLRFTRFFVRYARAETGICGVFITFQPPIFR